MADLTGGAPAAPVVVEYELEAEEVIPVIRWQLWRGRRFRVAAVGATALIVAGLALLLFTTGVTLLAALAIGVGAVQIVAFGCVLAFTPSRAWKALQADNAPRTLAFSDDGIHVQTALSDAVNQWAVYPETIELGDVYLLKIAQAKNHVIVPKRAFRLESEERRFRQMAERNTAARLRKQHWDAGPGRSDA
jgi:hypothetical protein